MCAYNIQNIFSLACRDRCISKLKTLIPPTSSKGSRRPGATVMVPLCRVNGIPSLLYTVRAGTLYGDPAGLITFPGGTNTLYDSAIQTALREMKYQLGLAPEKINVWGQAPAITSRDTDIMTTPVIGAIPDLRAAYLNINKTEVLEAFTVPIALLCDPKSHFYTQYNDGQVMPVFMAEDYKIWGVTAYITHAFLTCALSKDVYQNAWLKKKIDTHITE